MKNQDFVHAELLNGVSRLEIKHVIICWSICNKLVIPSFLVSLRLVKVFTIYFLVRKIIEPLRIIDEGWRWWRWLSVYFIPSHILYCVLIAVTTFKQKFFRSIYPPFSTTNKIYKNEVIKTSLTFSYKRWL